MAPPLILTADVGGTHARFAAFQGDRQINAATYGTAQCDDLHALARLFVDTLPGSPEIIVAAVAGPVKNNAVRLTNVNHVLSGEGLKKATGAACAYVINDFEAAAWATLNLGQRDVKVICGSDEVMSGTRVVVGPGTGLGVGALTFDGTDYRCVSGEGGHASVGPGNAFEVEVFRALCRLWPEAFFGTPMRAEAEAILSGSGLPLLFRAVSMVNGIDHGTVRASEIFRGALSGDDPVAELTIGMFRTHLAQFCGDLGLTFGADGVFIAGGLAQKNPWLFDAEFVESVAEGGRFSDRRRSLSLYLVHREDIGLIGAHHYACRHFN